MPSVISGQWLAFIDPHEKYFKHEGDQTTGYRYNLQTVRRFSHQIQPYLNMFGCDETTFKDANYRGTLFRFPLRRKATKLSETLYDPKKMAELFRSFEQDAHLVLLFLKHVESVQLCSRSSGQEMVTQFKVQVTPEAREQVKLIRSQFLQKISSGKWLDKPAEVVYPLKIETLFYTNGEVAKTCYYTWVISEFYAGGDSVSQELRLLSTDENLNNIPLVGVALPLDIVGPRQKKRKSIDTEVLPLPPDSDTKVTKKRRVEGEAQDCQDIIQDTAFEPEGQVFCFLPLPVTERSSTGLPVHVNGYFSISQNRRHLKWPMKGQDYKSDKALKWNMCLLQELVPLAYLNVIMETIQWSMKNRFGLTAEHVMAAMPDVLQVEAHQNWRVILEPLYSRLFNLKVFYSPGIKEAEWASVSDCVFDCLREKPDTCRVVRQVLLTAGMKVVKLPQHVMLALGAYCDHSLNDINPAVTRQCLLSHPSAYNSLSRDDKLLLLAYILKDEDFNHLKGIALLPTADDKFAVFSGLLIFHDLSIICV